MCFPILTSQLSVCWLLHRHLRLCPTANVHSGFCRFWLESRSTLSDQSLSQLPLVTNPWVSYICIASFLQLPASLATTVPSSCPAMVGLFACPLALNSARLHGKFRPLEKGKTQEPPSAGRNGQALGWNGSSLRSYFLVRSPRKDGGGGIYLLSLSQRVDRSGRVLTVGPAYKLHLQRTYVSLTAMSASREPQISN